MSSRTFTLVTLSVVLGLGAAWMANTWLNARLNATPDDNQQNVVVATVEIAFGQMVEPQQVALVRMPKETVPEDAFDATEKVVGKIATFSMLRGDILRGARLAEHLGGSTLASLIEPTKRAISVRVDDVVGVGGFLLPGNRVDVLATRQTGNTGDAESKTILEDLRVLAVDQTASTDKTQPVVVRAVTLEMTPQQAEELVKGMAAGKLQLALRNPLDNQKQPAMVEPVAMIQEVPAPPVVRPIVRRRPSGDSGITVIRGIEVNVVKSQL
ncbi:MULTISPECIES: Flp pilus assembly protein CpaB [Pseudomonas]|jgi:pilus assembly protein CpaB|uniref:Flp pilus assembly protein CpaB n=1 Tax=Pseudomonas TaxID=286 RepID=UPI00026E4897|nr:MULTISPECIES: Flp pilus assembly protein CpaB [Pseudomonas]AUG03812.1 Flp pilus assembly protein CpaB [Pseudomonas sp. 09C 129]AZD17554.1 Flp pilus assembly protein RcpC/CpaB [Pseudomonas chlororaphis]EJK99899.1 Flp pilus assembly protein, RcpC family [Pseudomonas chlororaphis subsp. aureofaciens 30-84]RON78635.1 Flp pilus assembly protein CpaB [Pseudomonas chlororaphis]WDH34068.1 Flp pilus assembly protein CpaB [Pseudomonas chlororaphis]